jgi:hypothetical protein
LCFSAPCSCCSFCAALAKALQGQVDLVGVLRVLGFLMMIDLAARHLVVVAFDGAQMIHVGIGQLAFAVWASASALSALALALRAFCLAVSASACASYLGLRLGHLHGLGCLGLLLGFSCACSLLLHLRRRRLAAGLLGLRPLLLQLGLDRGGNQLLPAAPRFPRRAGMSMILA